MILNTSDVMKAKGETDKSAQEKEVGKSSKLKVTVDSLCGEGRTTRARHNRGGNFSSHRVFEEEHKVANSMSEEPDEPIRKYGKKETARAGPQQTELSEIESG